MNLYTFSSKLKSIPLSRSLSITLCLLGGYHILVVSKLVPPTNGIYQWQSNFIKIQRYAYQKPSKSNIVLVGSSLTANLEAAYISSHGINLGMSGGSVQTGIQAVRRNPSKPGMLLVEINGTTTEKTDYKLINSIYNPFLYSLRLYFPMLRQEYQPISVFMPQITSLNYKIKSLKDRIINRLIPRNKPPSNRQLFDGNSNVTEKVIAQEVAKRKYPLTETQKRLFIEENQSIKSQILQFRKEGVQVVLFDIPLDQQLQNTVTEKQIKALMKEIFPTKNFDWLPEPSPRQWKTSDGIHLVSSDAKDYTDFIRNELLNKKVALFKPINEESTLKTEMMSGDIPLIK